MLTTPPRSSLQTDTKYVFVFWNNLFQDASTLTLVNNLRSIGIAVKVIDPVKSDSVPYKHRNHQYLLNADTTFEEALTLLPRAVCVVLPHDFVALDLVLAHPKYEVFIRKAAENDAQFVGYTELVALYALNRTVEKSFDWVYPPDGRDIGPFVNGVVLDLERLMK